MFIRLNVCMFKSTNAQTHNSTNVHLHKCTFAQTLIYLFVAANLRIISYFTKQIIRLFVQTNK